MKTKELIELLETCNEEAEVVLSQNSNLSTIMDVDQLAGDLVIVKDEKNYDATVIDMDEVDEVVNPSCANDLKRMTISVGKRVMSVYTSTANIAAIRFDRTKH